MLDLILYTFAVAYLVLAAVGIVLVLAVAVLWIRYGFYRLFPNQVRRWRQKRKERLIDRFFRSFDE